MIKARREEGFAQFFFEEGDAGYGGLIKDFYQTEFAQKLIAKHVDDSDLDKGTRAILRGMTGKTDGIYESSSDSVSGSELSEDSSSNMEGESELSDESSEVSDKSLPSSGDEHEQE